MAWLSRLVNEVESPAEFDRSLNDLYSFLREKKVKDDLGDKCVEATIELAKMIHTKEHHLANYVRMFITNCMDAHTTSPVECMNRVMKLVFKINAKQNIDTSVEAAVDGFSANIQKRNAQSLREMQMTLLSSRSMTKTKIIAKAQHLADVNYDSRFIYKGMSFSR